MWHGFILISSATEEVRFWFDEVPCYKLLLDCGDSGRKGEHYLANDKNLK